MSKLVLRRCLKPSELILVPGIIPLVPQGAENLYQVLSKASVLCLGNLARTFLVPARRQPNALLCATSLSAPTHLHAAALSYKLRLDPSLGGFHFRATTNMVPLEHSKGASTRRFSERRNSTESSDGSGPPSRVNLAEDREWEDVESDTEQSSFLSLVDDERFSRLEDMFEHVKAKVFIDVPAICETFGAFSDKVFVRLALRGVKLMRRFATRAWLP